MAAITENQLKTDIKSGNISNVYLFWGTDYYSIGLYTKGLINKLVDKDARDLNLHEFEGGSFDIGELGDACEGLPMFAEYNCCTVSDLNLFNTRDFSKESYDALISIIEDIPETTVLILYFSSLDICKGKKNPEPAYKRLINAVTKKGTVCSFPVKTAADSAKTAASLAKKKKCVIGENELRQLCDICAYDMLMISSELDKLSAYAQDKPITPEMIELLCPGEDDAKIYDLTDALTAHNKQRALSVFGELLDMRSEPIVLLYSILGTYIDLFRAKTALKNRKSASDVKSDFSYGARGFTVDKAFRNAGRIPDEQLSRNIRMLLDCERLMKSRPEALHAEILEETIIKMLS
ncbi:MAG: DNA polymerase III subunit delta [Oscillospiraceae bacterium]|nr:DNA polymerase III subunit delta [Oscillospiraceae bacterium]MDY2846609.1 DNA polymerase III subunit delta [Oscillospiraceae bacterium]